MHALHDIRPDRGTLCQYGLPPHRNTHLLQPYHADPAEREGFTVLRHILTKLAMPTRSPCHMSHFRPHCSLGYTRGSVHLSLKQCGSGCQYRSQQA